MFYSPDGSSKLLKLTVAISFSAALIVSPLALAAEEPGKEKLDAVAEKTLTGEIVDLMCYADHNASGDAHAWHRASKSPASRSLGSRGTTRVAPCSAHS